MEEKSTEPKLELSFVKGADLKREFQRLWINCWRAAKYGMEQRMTLGRELSAMREFLKQFRELDQGFALVCDKLEMDPSEARTRISLANTWDMIREYVDEHGLSIPMPERESWLTALFKVKPERRALSWVKICEQASDEQVSLTARWIEGWVVNQMALPVPTERVEQEPVDDMSFEVEADGEVEVSQDEVPRGTPQAKEAPKPTPGEGPEFKHPSDFTLIIDRIARLCGGGEPRDVEEWRKLISDPIKVKFEDLLAWHRHSDDDVRKIGRLIHGDMGKGLREAIRIVERRIDMKTTISTLTDHCQANGGRFEHFEGSFKIVVTQIRDRML